MKSRSAPRPVKYDASSRLAHDPQVRKWIKRLLGDPNAVASQLSEEELVYVHSEVLKRRGDEFNQSVFQSAMIETCPVLAAPRLDDTAGDLRLMFELPELREFWQQWNGPTGARGPTPNYPAAKALMAVMAMAGPSGHADDIHQLLRSDAALAGLFQDLEHERLVKAAEATDPDAEPVIPAALFSPGGYSTVMRLIPKLSPSVTQAAMAANVALVRSLRELLPDQGIGKRLLIDGSMVPAWCEQKGSGGDEARERRLRRHAPEAGFRAYYYDGGGKRDIKPGDLLESGMRAGRGKAWRGYSLIVIADQATGLPLVWTVQDASLDEAAAIVPLLSDLHRLWPDIDADCIAGDSAWDEDPWCRLCEVDYGIHPIFRLHGSKLSKAVQEGESRDGSISAYTHEGQLVCAQHNKRMANAGADIPSRDGLRPGQSNEEGRFRLRGLCDHEGVGYPSSRPGLRMKHDWSKLTFYPHYAAGQERRYAHRQAMLARLNQAESLFNRVKAGRKLATPGADRNRLRDKKSVDALLSLALLSMTALTVVDQRQQRQTPATPTRPRRRRSNRELDGQISPGVTASRVRGESTAPTEPGRPRLRLIIGGRT